MAIEFGERLLLQKECVDISKWDVSSATNLDYMFLGADAFRQNLNPWLVTDSASKTTMFDNVAAQAMDPCWCAPCAPRREGGIALHLSFARAWGFLHSILHALSFARPCSHLAMQ